MLRAVHNGPVFRHELHADLSRLGVAPGDTLLVHAAMSTVGWVCGGATDVVLALLDTVGPTGTVVVPAHTPDNRDPARWTQYPLGTVPERWWSSLREHLPPYDRDLTPSGGMGVIAERVRTWPGATRSDHPQTSFAAVGPAAEKLMAGHTLASQLGEDSPLARLAEARARVLLLGVGYDRCTAFHLAEYRLPSPRMRTNSCVMATGRGREWVTYETVQLDDSDFARLGHDFETATSLVRQGPVGNARSRLFGLDEAVGFARSWFLANR